jgi:hypothetical protein
MVANATPAKLRARDKFLPCIGKEFTREPVTPVFFRRIEED